MIVIVCILILYIYDSCNLSSNHNGPKLRFSTALGNSTVKLLKFLYIHIEINGLEFSTSSII